MCEINRKKMKNEFEIEAEVEWRRDNTAERKCTCSLIHPT